jgi:DNA primase
MLAVVGARTELKRAGANEYVGLCPFHDERTPSFGVNPHDKVYHCFGCQASGDLFSFVMETEGLDFTGALEALADRFGVQLQTEAEDPQAAARRERRERLHALLARAADFYGRYLWEADEAAQARAYLAGRGLGDELLREFQVGYAPSAWDRMLRASRAAGFSEDELLAAGLAQRSKSSPGRVYDRFRERLMFPTRDARGRVVGFGARAMRDNQQPKYLNSPEGELYHKRQVLYGIERARAEAARAGRMILVEGYTDVLALHQADLRNVVGIMGTSLTEEQIAELARIVKVLELCLDADSAGQEAMIRAAKLADAQDLTLRVVALPDGMDPAELVQQGGAEAIRPRVASSLPFAEFHIDRILARSDVSSAEGRQHAAAELGPVLATVRPGVLHDDLVRRVAGRLGLTEGQLGSLLKSSAPPRAPAPVPARRTPVIQPPRPELMFLTLCIALPDVGRGALAEADLDSLLTSETLRRAARHIASRTDAPLADLPPDDEELARAIADLVSRAGRMPDVSEARLDHARLVLERDRLDRAIRRARVQGQPEIGALAHEREEVLEQIHRVVGRLEEVV